MKLSFTKTFSILLLGILGATATHAQNADAAAQAEARLREALRTTMLQLRTAENERITLQTAHDGLLKESTDLKAQVKALAKRAADDQDASRKAIADLEKRIAALEADRQSLTQTVARWEKSSNEASELARNTETERARLAIKLEDTERLLEDREMKNVALFKVGSEILNRLESFGLGTAIKAREPFVGTKRVELQNLVQGYGDRLLDERIKPGSGIASSGTQQQQQ